MNIWVFDRYPDRVTGVRFMEGRAGQQAGKVFRWYGRADVPGRRPG